MDIFSQSVDIGLQGLHEQSREKQGLGYWFFMSYAHLDDDRRGDHRVQEFYEDLRSHVAGKTSSDLEPGYMDDMIETGSRWKDSVSRALRTSRVFVPIMTTKYFEREHCGKEWSVFEQRCRASTGSGGPPPLVVPVQFIPPREVPFPSFARDLHHAIEGGAIPDGLREAFDQFEVKGLDWIMRRRRGSYLEAYEAILDAYSDTIIRRGRAHPLPDLPEMELPDYTTVSAKFPARTVQASATARSHAREARLSVIAGSEQEMAAVRQDPQRWYGPNERAWRPYAPEAMDRVALVFQEEAAKRDLLVSWIAPTQSLPTEIRAAEAANTIALVVVDPWTAKLSSYRAMLQSLDGMLALNCAVLVVWSPDVMSAVDRQDLERAVKAALPRRTHLPTPIFYRDDIENLASLRETIRHTLRDVEGVLSQRLGPARPTPTNPGLSAPPTVSAHG